MFLVDTKSLSNPSILEQIRRLTLQGFGYTQKVQKCHVSLSPFDLTHVGSFNPGIICQFLLGLQHILSPRFNGVTQIDEYVIAVLLGRDPVHADIV
jgi:hypothetical protein